MPVIQIPLNVSGFWVPRIGRSHETTGSLGASLTLEPPVVFRIGAGSCPLVVNGICLDDYHPLVRELSSLGVSIHGASPVPLGVGSAVSGAIALALAYSYLYLRKGGRPDSVEVGRLAHRVEVETGGGLGDVICQITGGGLVVRTRPGPPGIGEAVPVPVERDVEVTLGVMEDRMTTRDMLRRYMEAFASVGSKVYKEFLGEPSLESFLRLSLEFSTAVGFMTPWLREILAKRLGGLGDGVLGYFAKKSLLVVVHRPNMGPQVRGALKGLCRYSLLPFKLSRHGFTVSPW